MYNVMFFLAAAKTTVSNWAYWVGDWVGDYKSHFFRQMIFQEYSRSKIETLYVGRVWWEVNAHYPTFAFSRSCAEDLSDEGTLRVEFVLYFYASAHRLGRKYYVFMLSILPSVILFLSYICGMHWRIFLTFVAWTEMNWLAFGIKRSRSQRDQIW